MGEKLFKIKEGSRNTIFCQGKEKFSGQVQGWLTCIQLVNFIPFCICLVCESFRHIFWQEKESNKQGVLPREIKSLLKTKLDSFPNFEHLTEEGRPVGGGKVLILVHIYSKQI